MSKLPAVYKTPPELLEALQKVLPPSYFTTVDGKPRLLIDSLTTNLTPEHAQVNYGLRWQRQTEQCELDSAGKHAVLVHKPEWTVGTPVANKPPHILIRGDNYHALNALKHTHRNSIDVIYIDPPYNTGNKDFVYNDNFSSADKFVNADDPFKHSKWLSFIEKRLKLAKELLRSGGVIFISIDENERAALELLCTSGLHFHSLGEIIWDKRSQKGGASAISTSHEHALVFTNSLSDLKPFNELPKPNAVSMHKAAQQFVKNAPDLATAQKDFNAWLRQNQVPPAEAAYNKIEINNGKVRLYQGTSLEWPQANANGSRFTILHPKTQEACVLPPKGLRCIESTYREWESEGLIVYGEDHTTQPRKKLYLDENMSEKVRSIFVHSKGGVTDLRAFNDNLDTKFSYPKPLGLIKHLLSLVSSSAVVLDFFAGSGTTAQAVIELNNEDGGSRQCIVATNDEGEFKDASGALLPGGICTNVTHPRISKVLTGYTNAAGKEVPGLPGQLHAFDVELTEPLPTPCWYDHTAAVIKNYGIGLSLAKGFSHIVEVTDKHIECATVSGHRLYLLFMQGSFKKIQTHIKSLPFTEKDSLMAAVAPLWPREHYHWDLPVLKENNLHQLPHPAILSPSTVK